MPLALAVVLLLGERDGASALESELVERLRREPQALICDREGRIDTVFGVPFEEAAVVFLAVGRDRPLPEGYEPPDLTTSMGRPVRRLIAADLKAMIEAAAADDVELAVVSGYRRPAEQAAALESAAWRQLARAQGSIELEEARARAARFVAPPGHSQHQLGTAVDLSTWELNYAVQPRFAETMAGRWVGERAWEFGFVIPYTIQGEARTGYAHEPWHLRWVGRPLAGVMWADRYLEQPLLVADDYLRAVEEMLTGEGLN
jgi:zinc D-Ala-D-Ala carboxypeptidase